MSDQSDSNPEESATENNERGPDGNVAKPAPPARARKPKVLFVIGVLKACAVDGEPLKKGCKLKVPTDISEADAKALVRMGRAELLG